MPLCLQRQFFRCCLLLLFFGIAKFWRPNACIFPKHILLRRQAKTHTVRMQSIGLLQSLLGIINRFLLGQGLRFRRGKFHLLRRFYGGFARAVFCLRLWRLICKRLRLRRLFCRNRPGNSLRYTLTDRQRICKTNLCFLRMHIHIHAGKRQPDVQYKKREAADHKRLPIALLHRFGQKFTLNHAPIYNQRLPRMRLPGKLLRADIAVYENRILFHFHRQQLVCNLRSVYGKNRVFQSAAGAMINHLMVVHKPDGYLRMRQNRAQNNIRNSSRLNRSGLYKFQPGRRIEKQILHGNAGAFRAACRPLVFHLAAL